MQRFFLFFLCLFGTAVNAQMPPQPVVLTTVKEGTLAAGTSWAGTFTPYNDVVLRAEISGHIDKLYVKEGASVKEGEKLFSLKDQEARARVKKAAAALKLAQNGLNRKKKLKEKEFISLQDLEKAEADVDNAEAELVLAEEDLNKTNICSPFEGVVSMKKVSKGTYVSPGTELIRIQDIRPMRLVFQVSQQEIPSLRVGDSVIAVTDLYPSRTFKGTVEAIDLSINETNRSVTAYATFTNQDNLLIPGLYGQITPSHTASSSPVVVIPEQALVVRPEGTYVYKKVKDKAILTKITLGVRTADQVEILSGLAKGEEIVIEGQAILHDGDPIVGATHAAH